MDRLAPALALAAVLLLAALGRSSSAESLEGQSVSAELGLGGAFLQIREKPDTLASPGPVPAEAAPAKEDYLRAAAKGIRRLDSTYNQLTGFYGWPSFSPGWWVSGNIVAMLARYAEVSGDASVLGRIEQTFDAAPMFQLFFLNHFYDDEGWWALAWLAAFDATGREKYLLMAEAIVDDMTGGWDDVCGGGIWWSKDRKYKNAIANELYLSASAGLAARVEDGKLRTYYFNRALAEWLWFSRSGMINKDGLVNDGLDASCRNNGETAWTYNQGVVLGGLAELAKVAPDPELRSAAEAVADAAIAKLSKDGVLRESCEPDCSGDGGMFKGAFIRNLAALDQAYPNPRYEAFIRANADRLLEGAEGKSSYGQSWGGSSKGWTPATQASALDLLVAAASIGR